MIVVAMIAIIAGIAIPSLIEARKTANEAAAVTSLRTLASVQARFREGNREGDFALDYATSLAELSNVGLIDIALGSGVKRGYVFALSGSTYFWRASATPVSSNTGARSFVICPNGVVRLYTWNSARCIHPCFD